MCQDNCDDTTTDKAYKQLLLHTANRRVKQISFFPLSERPLQFPTIFPTRIRTCTLSLSLSLSLRIRVSFSAPSYRARAFYLAYCNNLILYLLLCKTQHLLLLCLTSRPCCLIISAIFSASSTDRVRWNSSDRSG